MGAGNFGFEKIVEGVPHSRLPALIIDVNSREKLSNLLNFMQGAILIWNSNNSHGVLLLLVQLPLDHRLVGSNYHLHEKLKNLDMAFGFLQTRTPTIKPVSAQ